MAPKFRGTPLRQYLQERAFLRFVLPPLADAQALRRELPSLGEPWLIIMIKLEKIQHDFPFST